MTGEAAYLGLAARLAWRGFGHVAPNPMVGCVIVSPAGKIIGLGHHRRFGGLHAEAEALASCARGGHDPRGATAYVTLEPCSHTGKQPPCARALAAAGVAEVVAARRDPDGVSSGGFSVLEEAGIRTRLVPEPAAERVGAGFVSRVTRGRPWVTAKWAQTIDGRAATRDGESQWISGERSRRLVHRLRGRVDAVLVGAGTVLADDPMLTARGVRVRRRALRVVLDSSLRTPVSSALVRTAREVPVVIFGAEKHAQSAAAGALRDAGVVVIGTGTRSDGRVCAASALRELATRYDATEVLCEAGPTLTGALVREGLVDELLVFQGALLMGDPAARAPVDAGPAPRLDDASRWSLRTLRRLGDDVMSVYSRVTSAKPGSV